MDRKRRLLFGNNVGRGAAGAAAASFSATLLSSLVPEVFTGSSAPTMTRATTAYLDAYDSAGTLLKQVPSGCARLSGARFVRNLVTDVTMFSTGLSLLGAATGSLTANYATAPDGTTTATRMQVTWTNPDGGYNRVTSGVPNRCVNSLWMKSNTGSSQTVKIYAGDSTAFSVTVTTAWKRFATAATSGSFIGPGLIVGYDGTSGSIDILLAQAQMENTVGQSNENPSEYVSVGVAAAPYHGAGVDGCKYFTTQNGNTVASNVVTEATGAAISSATLLGYQAEGLRTNTFLQSQTLTAGSWAGGLATCTADQYVAPDGTTTMDKITASAGAGNHYWLQGAMAVSAGTTVVTAYVKYVNHQWALFYLNDGFNNLSCSFDLLNGVVGARAGGASSSSITATATAGVYRIQVVGTTVAGNFGSPGLCLQNADSSGITSWTAAGTEVVGAWGFQIEAGSFASSYIPTTTVAVTRNADVLTYSSASNVSVTTGSMYAEAMCAATGSNVLFGLPSSGSYPLYATTATLARIYDGTNIANSGTLSFVTGVRKSAIAWGGVTMAISKDGAAASSATFTGTLGASATFSIGGKGGGEELYGNIRNVSIWTTKKTDAELAALTA